MRNLSLLFIALLAIASTAWANDTSVVGIGGTVNRMGGEDTNIRMEQEWVNIDVNEKNYTVTATFKFVNDSDAAQTVEMGFPENGGGDGGSGDTPGFISFTSKVDNVAVLVERKLPRSKNLDGEGYQAYWVKKVTFQPRQTHWVQVEYLSNKGLVSAYPRNFIIYNFTGGNWKGLVSSSELLVTFHNPGMWLVMSHGVDFKQKENRLYRKWENWQAEYVFNVDFAPTKPDILNRTSRSYSEDKQYNYVVKNPGNSGHVEQRPDGLLLNNVAFVELDDLVRELGEKKDDQPIKKVVQDWDGKTNIVTLRVDDIELTFQPDSDIMKRKSPINVNEVLSVKYIKLLGKVFLLDDGYKKGEKLMYVPVADVVKALNGKFEEHLENLTIDYSF